MHGITLAMYIIVAEKQGVNIAKLRGTIQNDILKNMRPGNLYFPSGSFDAIDYQYF